MRFLVCWALAPVVVFTPAEWKLRYYLLPSLPALALLAAPLAEALVMRAGRPPARDARVARSPARSSSTLAGAAAFLVPRPAGSAVALPIRRRSRRSSPRVPGRAAVAPLVGGALLGIGGAAVALRLWGPLLALTGALAVGWFAVGAPRGRRRRAGRASLRRFAAKPPASASRTARPLVFYGLPVRSVVVYVGRSGAVARAATRAGSRPGLGVIATAPAYARLSADGRRRRADRRRRGPDRQPRPRHARPRRTARKIPVTHFVAG